MNSGIQKLNPELVVGGYVFWESNILLVLKKNEQQWVIPGGHIEYGETAERALAREVFEETGVRIKIKRFFKNTQLIASSRHLFCVDYICHPIKDNPGIILFPPSSEIQKAHWEKISKAVNSSRVAAHIKEGIKKALKMTFK